MVMNKTTTPEIINNYTFQPNSTLNMNHNTKTQINFKYQNNNNKYDTVIDK